MFAALLSAGNFGRLGVGVSPDEGGDSVSEPSRSVACKDLVYQSRKFVKVQ